MAAAGCVTAIRRIIEALNKDKSGLSQILPVIYPTLTHTLTPDGLEAIEEGLDCINILIYHGYDRNTCLPIELWNLLPQMIYVVSGNGLDTSGGFASEYLENAVVCIQNFISKDPNILLATNEQGASFFQQILGMVQRTLVTNAKSKSKEDGIIVLRCLIVLFEELVGTIE